MTDTWGSSLPTVVHEGGHMLLAIATGHDHEGWRLLDNGNAATRVPWIEHGGFAAVLTLFAGYPMPALVGLGGATVIRRHGAWPILWVSLVLLVAAFFQATNGLAQLFTLVIFVVVGLVALLGGSYLKASVAAGLVWWLLIGGAWDCWQVFSGGGSSDGEKLAKRTHLPAGVWHAAWLLISLACLWKGGRALLVG
jgi:hypothetical protein